MAEPGPLIIERTFPAPRKLVFEAFSTADHIKQWFSPEGLTTPEAEIDFRPGGVFVVCMRMPDGQEHWSRGTFTEVEPYDRLGFDITAGPRERPQFTARTLVTFVDAGTDATLMTVRQDYEVHDRAASEGSIGGAPEGWRTTLNKLERLVARMKAEG